MDDLVAFLRARYDEIDPNDYHDRTECDLGKLQFFGDCSCPVPAMVRHDIAAKRRILDEHAIIHRQIGWLNDGEEDSAEIPVCRSCVPKNSWFQRRADVPEGHCLTARLLALPYADQHHYREEWKP